MGLTKLTISLFLIAMFSLCLILFATNFAIDNDTSVSLVDDSEFSTVQTQLDDNITDFYTNAEISVESFGETTAGSQVETSEGGTQFKVPLSNPIKMVTSAISTGFTKIFGSDSEFKFIFTGFMSLLGVIVFWYGYKAWFGKNPD